MKEEALKKSELMLEEDAIRFDAFLKENDRMAHAAMKRAEEESRLKQQKVQEIKRLKYQIQALKGDNAKYGRPDIVIRSLGVVLLLLTLLQE